MQAPARHQGCLAIGPCAQTIFLWPTSLTHTSEKVLVAKSRKPSISLCNWTRVPLLRRSWYRNCRVFSLPGANAPPSHPMRIQLGLDIPMNRAIGGLVLSDAAAKMGKNNRIRQKTNRCRFWGVQGVSPSLCSSVFRSPAWHVWASKQWHWNHPHSIFKTSTGGAFLWVLAKDPFCPTTPPDERRKR